MKNILCPTDFKDASINAVKYAAKLAQQSGATLTLFNVQSLFELTPGEALMGKRYNLENAAQALDDACEEVRHVFRISCRSQVVAANTSVSSVIGAYGPDYSLIVMGTDSPDEWFSFMQGSNTYQTIRKTSAPLLMVPGSVGYQTIDRILYAIDLTASDSIPMEQAVDFARNFRCHITLLQVSEGYRREQEVALDRMVKSVREKYKEQVLFSFETIFDADVVVALGTQMKKSNSDVLAVCSLNRNFLERILHKSVIRQLSHVANYPILVFHA